MYIFDLGWGVGEEEEDETYYSLLDHAHIRTPNVYGEARLQIHNDPARWHAVAVRIAPTMVFFGGSGPSAVFYFEPFFLIGSKLWGSRRRRSASSFFDNVTIFSAAIMQQALGMPSETQYQQLENVITFSAAIMMVCIWSCACRRHAALREDLDQRAVRKI